MRPDRIHPKSLRSPKPAQAPLQKTSLLVNLLSTSYRHLTYSRNHLPNPQQPLRLPPLKLELRRRQMLSPHPSLRSLRLKWRRRRMRSRYLRPESTGPLSTLEMPRHQPNPLPLRSTPGTPLELPTKALLHLRQVCLKTPSPPISLGWRLRGRGVSKAKGKLLSHAHQTQLISGLNRFLHMRRSITPSWPVRQPSISMA